MVPRDKRFYVWDTQLAGFGVKVLPVRQKNLCLQLPHQWRAGWGQGTEPVAW